VASRKQRRRRQKQRRHEYEYVYVDEHGQEIEFAAAEAVAEVEEPAAPPPKPKSKPKAQAAPSRGAREVPPPSWRRVGKRGLIFAPFMFVTLLLLDQDQPYDLLAINTLVLLAFFLPFSYVLDTLMYRLYVRRTGGQPARGAPRRN
jgi:hypothetical protein